MRSCFSACAMVVILACHQPDSRREFEVTSFGEVESGWEVDSAGSFAERDLRFRATIHATTARHVALLVECTALGTRAAVRSLAHPFPATGEEPNTSLVRYHALGGMTVQDTWRTQRDGMWGYPEDGTAFIRALASADSMFVEVPGGLDATFVTTGLAEALPSGCV